MVRKLISSLAMVSAGLLLITYMILNGEKLTALSTQWTDYNSGTAAPIASLKLSEDIVYQYRLKTSDILDATGKYQINILPLPEDVFAKTLKAMKTSQLVIGKQATPLSGSTDESALLAMTNDRKIYLVADNMLKPMMTAIWNEQQRLNRFIYCANQELCQSLRISSPDFGPFEGPFSKSDFIVGRRGLPRGRWARGPVTRLDIQSSKKQEVWLQLNLLAVHRDQKISFRGAVSQAQQTDQPSETVMAAGKSLTSAVHIVLLNLEPGTNTLEISFSIWDKPGSSGKNPVGAYITAIGIYGYKQR